MSNCHNDCNDENSRYRLKVSHEVLYFGNTEVGTFSQPIEVIVENDGWADIILQEISPSGPFAIDRTKCPDILRPGRTGVIKVTFIPTSFGPWVGSLYIKAGRAGDHMIRLLGAAYSGNETGNDLAGIPIFEVRADNGTDKSLENEVNLVFDNGTIALVYADPILSNDDFYKKVGESGTGHWEPAGLLAQAIDQTQEDMEDIRQVANEPANFNGDGLVPTRENGSVPTLRKLQKVFEDSQTEHETAWETSQSEKEAAWDASLSEHQGDFVEALDNIEAVASNAPTDPDPNDPDGDPGTVTVAPGIVRDTLALTLEKMKLNNRFMIGTYVGLVGIANQRLVGMAAEVSPNDTGTHASVAGDVGATDGQTPNSGIYNLTVGNIWVRIGELTAPSIALPGDIISVNKAQSPAGVEAQINTHLADIMLTLAKFGTPIDTGLSQSGFRYVVVGQDSNLLFGITDDAIPVLIVGDEAAGGLREVVRQLTLQVAKFGTTFDTAISQSGYRYFIFGDDSSFMFGITDDPIPALEAAAFNMGDTQFRNLTGMSQGGRNLVIYGMDGREVGGASDDGFMMPTGIFSPFHSARGEYICGTKYDLFTRRDNNNDMQVYSLDRTTGAVTRLSGSGCGNINVAFDPDQKRAIWATSAADRWPSNQMRSRRLDASFPMSHLFPMKRLLVSGDSVDNGSVATGSNSYANRLRDGLGLALTMRAIGGQQLWQQAMQLGAIPTYVLLASALVGTTATAISKIGTINPRTGQYVSQDVVSGNLYPNTLLLTTGADITTRSITGWVIDSEGNRQRATITRQAAGGPPSTTETYTIVSAAGAAITTSSTLVQFIPDTLDQLSYIASFGGGLNDLGQGMFATPAATPADILADVRAVQDAVIDALGPASPVFIIQGMYNQASAFTVTGSDADLAIIAHNNDRRAKYPGRFVDRFAIFAAGGDGSANDNSDIANHWVPRSLRGAGDIIHPNDAGHGLVYTGNSGGLGAYALLSRQIPVIPSV